MTIITWGLMLGIYHDNEMTINSIGVVSLVLYFLIQFSRKKESQVKVDVCIVPISIMIISGALAYYQQEDASRNLWGYLIPHITASVGLVTFWAFWAQIKANEIIKISEQKNRIETTFFKMLDIHRENIKDISIENDQVTGKDAIKKLCELLLDAYEKSGVKISDFHEIYGYFFERDKTCLEGKTYEGAVKKILTDSTECHSALATYSFHIYRTVKYIMRQDKDVLSFQDKIQYMHIIRGQMTREEQLFLFNNWFAGYQRAINGKRAFGSSWEETKETAKNSAAIQTFLSDTKLLVYCNRKLLITEIEKHIQTKHASNDEYAKIVRIVLIKQEA